MFCSHHHSSYIKWQILIINNKNKIYYQSKQITAKYANIYYGADKLDQMINIVLQILIKWQAIK